MSQNSVIAFGLIVGFIVFITIRGELPKYFAVFGISSGTAQSGVGSVSLPTLPNLSTVFS